MNKRLIGLLVVVVFAVVGLIIVGIGVIDYVQEQEQSTGSPLRTIIDLYPSVSETPNGEYNTTVGFDAFGHVGSGTIEGLQVCVLDGDGETLNRVSLGTMNISEVEMRTINVTTENRPKRIKIVAENVYFTEVDDSYEILFLAVEWQNGGWIDKEQNITQWQYDTSDPKPYC